MVEQYEDIQPVKNHDIYEGNEMEGYQNGECADCDKWAGAGHPNHETETIAE
jgi:hypothetical protein